MVDTYLSNANCFVVHTFGTAYSVRTALRTTVRTPTDKSVWGVKKRHILITKVLLFTKRYYLGPYKAIILPCLFPCGAPLG